MYILPGYVDYYEENGAVFITSRLRQNTVKLTDPEALAEFNNIVKCGGCPQLSTSLSRFLHEQELLSDETEIQSSINELRSIINSALLITIMPTEGCNFRCPYCYESHEPISMQRKTLDLIQKYIEEQAPHFKHITIAWFGGEPTLCKDVILETSRLVQQLQEKASFRYTSSMTTNGYLLSPEDFKQYYNVGITSYQITLDGWQHDQTRPHVTGKGTLQKILDNLIKLSMLPQEQFQFHIMLRHNILPNDVEFSWYDHLYNLFGHDNRFSVLVRPVSDWGGDSVGSLELLKGNEIEENLRRHVEYLKKIGMPCENGRRSPLSQICYANYPHSMVFRPSGKIEKCTVCLDHPKNFLGYVDPEKGVVLDETINQLWSASEINPECYHCNDVLACLNMQCKKSLIVEGKNPAQASCSLSTIY